MNIDEIRAQFPITRRYNFQDHACVSPLSTPAAEAMTRYARDLCERGYGDWEYHREVERVRQSVAKLINAHPDEVTFVKNTTEGLNYVANGTQWITGDNVVLNSMEFPANIYPWMNLEQRGVNLKWVAEEDGRVPFDRLAATIDKRTRVLAISAVQWSNGFRTDLVRLGELCQDKGVLLCVDAIQALGVHPVDVQAMNIDFLAADGHKWLCAPEGAGVFYCRRELLEHLRPSELGYLCMKDDWESPQRRINLRNDARRFDSGAYNIAGICALGASVDMLLDMGIERIQWQVKQLTDLLAEGVRRKGWQVASPRTPSEWSGIVAFSSDKHDLAALQKHLLSEFKIVISRRLGRLRASPHCYNCDDEIQQLIEALPTVRAG